MSAKAQSVSRRDNCQNSTLQERFVVACSGRRALRQVSALVDDVPALGGQLPQEGLLNFGVLAHVQLSWAVWPAFRRR